LEDHESPQMWDWMDWIYLLSKDRGRLPHTHKYHLHKHQRPNL
jgi:hypothetical protein